MSVGKAPHTADHLGAPHGLDAQPADDYFDVMASVAESHWWYRGRRTLVAQLLRGRVRKDCVAVDVGCGTSETLDVLESLGARAAVGSDLSDHALDFAMSRRPRPRVMRALAEELPLRDHSAGVLVSMDVIEHLDDDVAALHEYVRVLEPGAPIMITVPAYEWLWSEHDEQAFHRRRYTHRTLDRAARDAGIAVEQVTYYYSFLLPAAALLRRTPLRHVVRASAEDVSAINPVVDGILAVLAMIERWLARWVRIPFGLSIALVGRAPGVPTPRTSPRFDHNVRSDRVERLKRQSRVWRLSARRGANWVTTKVRGAGRDAERRAELEEQFVIRSAEDVARELGQMKGAVMKLGQMISFVADGLPPEAQAALASLQQDVPPMAPTLAEQVLREELGRGPEQLFLHWDPVPVAAASIGQVHKAVLHDGREVAVKIQYPGIDQAIRHDLDDVEWLSSLLSSIAFHNLDVTSLVEELRGRMNDELDYRLELARQGEFAERYAGHPFIRIPHVVPERSDRRVLTTEWIDGMTWSEFDATATDAQRQFAGEVIFRFAQGSVHRDRVFNGDPHPGNYRFHPDGTVTFLDFGLVKRWDADEFDSLFPVLDTVLARDAAGTTDAMVRAGFLAPDHGLDADHVFECVSAPYRAFLEDEFTFSPSYTTDALTNVMDLTGPYADVIKALNMPASFVILDRVVWGVSALLGRLGAHNRWRGILEEYRHDGAPVTDLGHAEALWLASR